MQYKIREIIETNGTFTVVKYQPGFKQSFIHRWRWGSVRISKQMAEATIERWKIIYQTKNN